MGNKIAIQGIPGSFHEMAARKYFGNGIEIYPCDTFKQVCTAVTTGQTDYAAMAIENTLAGSILPNYALMREHHLRIIGEVYLHIQMFLMGLPDAKLSDIEFIHSHPIAIRQCSDYLQNLRKVKVVEKNDTAEAAKEIGEKQLKNTAAIAAETAAAIYGLSIIEKRIETHKRNFTRFLILSKEGVESDENNKASICFELGHKVGALANILNVFTEYNINLTKIQSIPIIGKPYEYSFHIDLEWQKTSLYERAIHKVLKEAANLSILGEYKHSPWETNGKDVDKWVEV